jgi:hypothetical protein
MEMEAASRESVLPWNYFCQRSRRRSACWAAYRLEDPNGISLAGIVEQQVRANKPGKARAYDGDLLAWLLHAEVAVDVSRVELESCGLLLRRHGVQIVPCPRQTRCSLRTAIARLCRNG